MTSGDHIVQYGHGSIGRAEHSGSGDIVAGGKVVNGPESSAAIDTLLVAVESMRQYLDESDLAEIDSAVQQIDPDGTVSELGGPLRKIAGIASVIGDVGVPVINAIKGLLG
jgi:hypothetical protein